MTGDRMTSGRWSDRRHSALVFLFVLVVYGWVAWTTPAPGFAKYTRAAEMLRDGTLTTERLVDFSPFYLFLASLADGLPGSPDAWLLGFQLVLAAVALVCAFRLVAARLGRGAAWIAALVLVFDRHLLVYHRILEPETVLLALLLALLLLLETPGRWAAVGAGVAAAFSLATRPTFLPVFAAVPLYLWWQERRAGETSEPIQDDDESDHRFEPMGASWRRKTALFLLPVACAAGLLALRSLRITGSPSTPVMNPGTVFYEGNQPLSRGTSAIYPPLVLALVRHNDGDPDSAHDDYRRIARAAPGMADADVVQVNAAWAGRARAALAEAPAAGLSRVLDKLVYAFHGFRWHDVTSAWMADAGLGLPYVPIPILSALAVLGLLAEARRWPRALPFYILAAMQLGVMLVFYVSARQRTVLMPALVYFALAALSRVPALWRTRRGALVLAAVLALLLMVSFALPDDAMRDESHVRRTHAEAGPRITELRESGVPLAQSRDEVVETLASAPWALDWMRPLGVPQDDRTLDDLVADRLVQRIDEVPAFERASTRFDLAMVLLAAGRLDEAESHLRVLVDEGFVAYRGGRHPSDPRILLARLHGLRARASGRSAAEELSAEELPARELPARELPARELLGEALAANPGDPWALAEAAALGFGTEERIAQLDRIVGPPDRRWLYGQALLVHGRFDEAARQLGPLAAAIPDLRDLRLRNALALGGAGRLDAAVAELVAANALVPEPVFDVEATADIVQRWADTRAGDAEAQLLAARLLHQQGMYGAARERLGRAEGDLPPHLAERATELRRRLDEADL